MLLENKTQQLVHLALPPIGEDFCSECGQSLDLLVPSSTRQAASWDRRPWILAALGIYLAVAFGIEAGSAYRLVAARQADLGQVAAQCVTLTGIDPSCYDDAAKKGLDPVLASLARYASVEQAARRDLAVATIGLVAGLTGIGAAVRSRSQSRGGPRTSKRARLLRLVLDIAVLGETALTPCAQIFLGATGVLAVARLLRGTPPTWELVAWGIHRTIELVIAIVQNA